MNGPPIPPEPSDGFDLDEALNALIDDELAAFAHDHGMSEYAVRTRLVAAPDFTARRAAFEQTRAAVRESVAPLDDVTRRRLVRDALDAGPGVIAPTPRSRRWIAITAIAAAALLVVAGIGVAVSSMGGSSSRSSSSDSGASSAAPLRGDVGDLGDVTSAAALKALLDRRAAESGTTSTTRSAAQSELATGGATKRASTPSAASTAKCAQELAGKRSAVFTGTGTYQGAPVTIVGIASGDRTIVFVVSDTDCTNVVASISR